MIINGAAAIDQHKREINELNVFPVPDGDTGTNMCLTMNAGAKALDESSPGTIGRAADLAASALLRGARGNSGVILSLLFRGIARHLKDLDTADAFDIAGAISAGVDSAYKAVMKPAEGTILTVSRMAAGAAVTKSEQEDDIETVLQHALGVGYEALDDTINQNPVLKKAGVIDAGGKGYLYILEGMLGALRGERLEFTSDTSADTDTQKADFSDFSDADIKFAYCTEFIIDHKLRRDVNHLRDFLDMRGDSIVVVDDDTIIKVHVHTNDPGVVLTEALTYGALLSVKIENMKEQHTEKLVEAAAQTNAAEPVELKPFAIVAVCAGEGMRGVFTELGADSIIYGGQTMNPSTEDILKQIDAAPSDTVLVLPNNKNIIMAAQQCVRLSDKTVVVLPSKTMPQGVSAMIAMDPSATAEENAAAMTEAIGRVHTAQLTYAARDSEFDGHHIKAGDYLALLEDSLVATGHDTITLINAVAAALSQFSPEFVTIFTGVDVSAETADEVLRRLTQALPSAEVSVIDGGQPVYYLMISAE